MLSDLFSQETKGSCNLQIYIPGSASNWDSIGGGSSCARR